MLETITVQADMTILSNSPEAARAVHDALLRVAAILKGADALLDALIDVVPEDDSVKAATMTMDTVGVFVDLVSTHERAVLLQDTQMIEALACKGGKMKMQEFTRNRG